MTVGAGDAWEWPDTGQGNHEGCPYGVVSIPLWVPACAGTTNGWAQVSGFIAISRPGPHTRGRLYAPELKGRATSEGGSYSAEGSCSTTISTGALRATISSIGSVRLSLMG